MVIIDQNFNFSDSNLICSYNLMILLINFLKYTIIRLYLKIVDVNLLMIKTIRMLTTFTPLRINLSNLYVQLSQKIL